MAERMYCVKCKMYVHQDIRTINLCPRCGGVLQRHIYDPDEFFSAERKLCNDPATLTEAKRNWYMEGFKVGYFQCLGDYVLGKIEQNVSEKPTTSNADRIRAMSDEELAEFIETCACPPHKDCAYRETGCVLCWLDWLKQEVEQ